MSYSSLPYEVGVDEVYEIWKYKCYVGETLANTEVSLDQISLLVNDIRDGVKFLKQERMLIKIILLKYESGEGISSCTIKIQKILFFGKR